MHTSAEQFAASACTKTASKHATFPSSKTSHARICSPHETDKLDGLPVNIGSACGTPIREIAEQLADILKIDIAPELNGEFRPGEMRHLTSDTTLARSAGYKPTVDLGEGISRYIDWIRKQSDIRDYFSEASDILKNKGIVHRVAR